MSPNEDRGIFLEGTGSIVFDHPAKVGYACHSPRTDAELFKRVCQRLGYKPIMFTANEDGMEVYHTNVMMWIGTKIVGVCLECIGDEKVSL